MKPVVLCFCLLAALCLWPATSAQAQYSIWQGPLGLKPGDATITVACGSPSQAARITTTTVGTSKWVHLSLALPSDVTLHSVDICYQLNDPTGAFITQTRITSMLTPDGATVEIDDGTDRVFNVGCYRVEAFDLEVSSAITLSLRLDVSDITDYVEIGAITLNLIPTGTDVGDAGRGAEGTRVLAQNRPNPFDASTRISYQVPAAGPVSVRVFNAAGQLVRGLVDEVKGRGEYTVIWDGRDDEGRALAAGVYYYRVSVDGTAATDRMVLLK